MTTVTPAFAGKPALQAVSHRVNGLALHLLAGVLLLALGVLVGAVSLLGSAICARRMGYVWGGSLVCLLFAWKLLFGGNGRD